MKQFQKVTLLKMQMKLLQKWVTLGFVRDSCYILYDMMSCFLLNTVVSFGRTCHALEITLKFGVLSNVLIFYRMET